MADPGDPQYEAWSDARAFDGTDTIQQPQVRRLYGGHSAQELLAVLLADTSPDDYALVRGYWQREAQQRGLGNFEEFVARIPPQWRRKGQRRRDGHGCSEIRSCGRLAAADAGRSRNHLAFPSRPARLGRPVCGQRVVTGNAAPVHPPDLG